MKVRDAACNFPPSFWEDGYHVLWVKTMREEKRKEEDPKDLLQFSEINTFLRPKNH